MNTPIHFYETPRTLEEAIAVLPDPTTALGWGKQTFGHGLLNGMILLASKNTEHYRYKLAVSLGIAQVLYQPVNNTVVEREHFIRCEQKDSLIGHYDAYDVHVIQVDPDGEDEALMLLICDDNDQVVGHIFSEIRPAQDHIVTMMKPPKK